MAVMAALSRDDVANYVSALFDVYIAIIFIYLLSSIALSLGARPPYSRVLDAILAFLREVSEPYLRPFRKVIPQFGMIDLSPLVALILLYVIDSLVVSAISG